VLQPFVQSRINLLFTWTANFNLPVSVSDSNISQEGCVPKSNCNHVLGHTIFQESLSQGMQHNLICIQNLGSPDVEKLDMDWDSAHVHDLTCWFKSHSLVFLTTGKNEKICNRNNYVWVIENFQGQFYNLLLFWQILYMMQNLKWRMDWCPMASYVRLSTLKMWDGNIPNVILVKCKFSALSTPCLESFPLTPLEIIKGGSYKFLFLFFIIIISSLSYVNSYPPPSSNHSLFYPFPCLL